MNLPLSEKRPSKYGYRELAVGESVTIEGLDGHRARNALTSYAKRSGKTFTTTSLDDGVRIERTA